MCPAAMIKAPRNSSELPTVAQVVASGLSNCCERDKISLVLTNQQVGVL